MTAIIKYLTPHVILDLNKKLYQNGGWAALYKSVIGFKNSHLEKIGMVYIDRNACIVQSTSNMIAHDAVKNGLYESIWDFLITTSTVTCVSDALDLHIDEPKSNPILKGNKGFVETRVLIPIQFLSSSNIKHPPLGRGDGGPGVFIVGLIDHSISFTQKVGGLKNYKDFRRQEGIELNLEDFWEVVNDPNHTERNNENIKNAVDKFELLRNDLEIS